MKLGISKNNFFPVLFWALFPLLAFVLLYHHLLDSDDGVVLAGAWEMLNGQRLYYDIFQFTPPGSFYLIFSVFKLFSASYLAAKFVAIGAIIISAAGIYKISRTLFPVLKYLNYLGPVLFLFNAVGWNIISYHNFNISCLIWSTYFIIKILRTKNYRYVIYSGLLAGLANIFLLHRTWAFLFAVTFIFFVWSGREKNIFWFKSGLIFLATALLPLFGLTIIWPLKLLLYDLIIFPLIHYPYVNRQSFIPYIVVFSCLAFVATVVKWRGDRSLLFLVWLEFCLFLSTYSRPDLSHLTLVIFPLYILFPLFIKKILKFSFIFRYYALGATAIVVFMLLWPGAALLLNLKNLTVDKNNGLMNFLKNNCPDDEIYAGPFIPHFYFEARKLNPLPYSWLLTGLNPPEHFDEAAKILSAKPPQCAITNYHVTEKFRYNIDSPLDNFIKGNYREIFLWGNFTVLKKI